MRILLVEDNRRLSAALARSLADAGYAVDAASLSEPLALVFTVTLNWPARVAPGARAGRDHAT